MADPPVAVVFGARNVGRAVVADRLARGWRALAVARTEATLERLSAEHPGVVTMAGDASDPASVAQALRRARDDLNGLDLVVNAVTAPPRDGSFGGGPVVEAPPERLKAWMDGFVPHAWEVLRAGGAALAAQGHGTIIQVSGGSARRGLPGRGSWGAAQAAARALTQSMSQELRPANVHVALLIADGMIWTERNPRGDKPERNGLAAEDVADAVAYIEGQSPRAWTHELVITPAGDTYTP